MNQEPLLRPSSFKGGLTVLFLFLGLGTRCLAQAGPPEMVEAVVVYGDQKLIEDDEALTDEQLGSMLDSLCTLDPAPQHLIRDLRLFLRIRRMDETQMVTLIDSLFELDTVPYALVNEINLYVDQLPTRAEVDQSSVLAWSARTMEPFFCST